MDIGESSYWVGEYDVPFSFTPKRKFLRSKKIKLKFTGWGSTLLVRFLQSIGQDTSSKITQYDVASIIDKYVNANHLLHPTKKKRIVCDDRLYALFGKKSLSRIKIYDMLEQHFAENREESSSDEFGFGEDDDDLFNFLEEEGQDDRNNVESQTCHKKAASVKSESPKKRSGFAAILPENIRLVYLKKSLVEELLLNDPRPTFEAKIVGSFVRIKNDPNDYLQKCSHQLLQVTGVKDTGNNNSCAGILLQVSHFIKDVCISMLSDDNFSEEECENLCQRMKDALLKIPTVLEFEEKARALHEDITKHWLVREIALLQKLIDRANEKGWRKELFEYIEKKQLLQKPEEHLRLLHEVPNVIAEVEVEATPRNLPDIEQQGSSDSPVSILRGALETPICDTAADKASLFGACPGIDSASESLTFVRYLQEGGKWGNNGLSVSIPGGASEIPICDNVAKGTSTFWASAATISAENHNVCVQEWQNLQTEVKSKSNDMMQSVNRVEERQAQVTAARQVIDLSDDEESKDPVVLDPPFNEDLQSLEWHYADPQGDVQGPFSLASLKRWWDAEYFPLDFDVWRRGENRDKAVLLINVLHGISRK